jgi:ribonuclease VapC
VPDQDTGFRLFEPPALSLFAPVMVAAQRTMAAFADIDAELVKQHPVAILARGLWDVIDRFLRDAKIDIVPVDADLAARAMSGWRRYGKGHHPAGLNFGDCFTYALAERTGHPVLCVGDDFAATDIAVVRPQAGPDPA